MLDKPGSGSPLNFWQRLVLFCFVHDFSASYEAVRRHNLTLVRKNERLTRCVAQLKLNRGRRNR